ncbi:MAG: hypothetical protein HW411_1287 [Gammaproteobacteria bacterium]|nr:hypothetical protein [Gammaproteobacteria bacterium]
MAIYPYIAEISNLIRNFKPANINVFYGQTQREY